MAKAVRVLALVLGGLVAVLAVTGVWLVFEYRPGPPDAMRRTHQVASFLAVWTALFLFGATLWQRRLYPVLAGAGCLVAVVAASLTGFLLPWDSIGLWAVTVGGPIDGAWTDTRPRFYIVGSVEVSVATYLRWLLVHTVGIPLAVAAAYAARKFLLRR